MNSETKVPTAFKGLALVLGITAALLCAAVGYSMGAASRDTEIIALRKARSAAEPVWRRGYEKKYGGIFTIVSLDRGKNFYAAVRKGGEIVILGEAEKIYPGVFKTLEQQEHLGKGPGP